MTVAAGDLWTLPGGHRAIELDGSSRDVLRVAVIAAGWQWLRPAQEVARTLCAPAPMRYLHGATSATEAIE